MIESIFDVKRQALRALSSIKQQYTAALNAFINASINNLNQALVATQNGITLSKTLVADLASQVTIDNISEGITDAQDSINDVISKYSIVNRIVLRNIFDCKKLQIWNRYKYIFANFCNLKFDNTQLHFTNYLRNFRWLPWQFEFNWKYPIGVLDQYQNANCRSGRKFRFPRSCAQC